MESLDSEYAAFLIHPVPDAPTLCAALKQHLKSQPESILARAQAELLIESILSGNYTDTLRVAQDCKGDYLSFLFLEENPQLWSDFYSYLLLTSKLNPSVKKLLKNFDFEKYTLRDGSNSCLELVDRLVIGLQAQYNEIITHLCNEPGISKYFENKNNYSHSASPDFLPFKKLYWILKQTIRPDSGISVEKRVKLLYILLKNKKLAHYVTGSFSAKALTHDDFLETCQLVFSDERNACYTRRIFIKNNLLLSQYMAGEELVLSGSRKVRASLQNRVNILEKALPKCDSSLIEALLTDRVFEQYLCGENVIEENNTTVCLSLDKRLELLRLSLKYQQADLIKTIWLCKDLQKVYMGFEQLRSTPDNIYVNFKEAIQSYYEPIITEMLDPTKSCLPEQIKYFSECQVIYCALQILAYPFSSCVIRHFVSYIDNIELLKKIIDTANMKNKSCAFGLSECHKRLTQLHQVHELEPTKNTLDSSEDDWIDIFFLNNNTDILMSSFDTGVITYQNLGSQCCHDNHDSVFDDLLTFFEETEDEALENSNSTDDMSARKKPRLTK